MCTFHRGHEAENRELARLVDDFLPLGILVDDGARRLVSAALIASAKGQTVDQVLTSADPPDNTLVEFADSLARNPSKIRGTEITVIDAAQQCILGIWRRRFMQDRIEIDQRMAQADAGLRDSLQRERSSLTQSINALADRNWATGLPLVKVAML